MLVIMAKCLLWGRRNDTQKSLTTGDSCICLRGAPWHLFSATISPKFSVMFSVAFFTYTIPYISRDGRYPGRCLCCPRLVHIDQVSTRWFKKAA